MVHATLASLLTIIVLLGGCASVDKTASVITVRNNILASAGDAGAFAVIEPAAGKEEFAFAVRQDPPAARDCRLRDRFDRKELIAYNFADGQSRLGLKLGVDGFNLSNAGDFEFQNVKVNFRYRLQPLKKPREKCLYESAWQGLGGSVYNELVEREQDTIYQRLDDRFDSATDRIEKIF